MKPEHGERKPCYCRECEPRDGFFQILHDAITSPAKVEKTKERNG